MSGAFVNINDSRMKREEYLLYAEQPAVVTRRSQDVTSDGAGAGAAAGSLAGLRGAR